MHGTRITLHPLPTRASVPWSGIGRGLGGVRGLVTSPGGAIVGSILTGGSPGDVAGAAFDAFRYPIGSGISAGSSLASSLYGHHWTPMDQQMELLFPD